MTTSKAAKQGNRKSKINARLAKTICKTDTDISTYYRCNVLFVCTTSKSITISFLKNNNGLLVFKDKRTNVKKE